MPKIEKGQHERILKSIEVLKIVCELFDQIPAHERRADINFLIGKYENEKQYKRDAWWKWKGENS